MNFFAVDKNVFLLLSLLQQAISLLQQAYVKTTII